MTERMRSSAKRSQTAPLRSWLSKPFRAATVRERSVANFCNLVLACCLIASAMQLSAQPRQPRNTADIPQTNPYSSAADVEAGRKIFGGRCGHCHGQDGEGGRGAVLNSGELHHGASDREMF